MGATAQSPRPPLRWPMRIMVCNMHGTAEWWRSNLNKLGIRPPWQCSRQCAWPSITERPEPCPGVLSSKGGRRSRRAHRNLHTGNRQGVNQRVLTVLWTNQLSARRKFGILTMCDVTDQCVTHQCVEMCGQKPDSVTIFFYFGPQSPFLSAEATHCCDMYIISTCIVIVCPDQMPPGIHHKIYRTGMRYQ